MNEDIIVAELAQLSGVPAEELKTILADETKSKTFFETYKTANVIYKKDDFDRLMVNKKDEILEAHSKDENIHKSIYDRVAGTIKEKTEKAIAKKFGISEYSSLEDLIEKAEAKFKTVANDGEKDTEIERLKKLVRTVEGEKTTALEEKDKKVDGFIVKTTLSKAINNLAYDFTEPSVINTQKEIVEATFLRKYEPEVIGDMVAAKNKETGEIAKDRVGDPVPIETLLGEFAPTVTKIKNVPLGSRGDKSSQTNTNTDLAKVTNAKDWKALLDSKGITNEGGKEATALYAAVKKANPDFKMI